MPGLLYGASTHGVGLDIVKYLESVAQFFDIKIRVTSGYRSPSEQAQAMFNNWIALEHGKVYKSSTLPEPDRVKLDGYWTLAHGQATPSAVKASAQTGFLELAMARVGSKSKHSQGRAIDVSRIGIDKRVYGAILLRLHNVKEGNRIDIYHFESSLIVPPVDDAMKAKWQSIKNGSPHLPAPRHHHGQGCWC